MESLNDYGVTGWAWNPVSPNAPLTLSIVITSVNNPSITYHDYIYANIYRSELQSQGYGDGKHGFSYNIDWSSIPSGLYKVDVIIPNTTLILYSACSKTYFNPPKTEPTGNLDTVSSTYIQGWAWNSSLPMTPLQVHIRLTNMQTTQVWTIGVIADLYASNLKDGGIGDGKHVFHYNINWSAYPQGYYKVEAFPISGTNPILNGAPKYYENGISEPTGNLEEVSNTNIRGWAWNAKFPNTSLEIHIKLVNNNNGNVYWIGGVNANQFRIDLLQNGIGNGYHEFNYNINWDNYPLGNYSVYVYPISGTNPPVAGCPKYYENRLTEPTGHLEDVSSNNISGWAWNEKYPNTPIDVHVRLTNLQTNQVWETPVSANKLRSDLAPAGIGNGIHGFSFDPGWSSYPQGYYKVEVFAMSGTNPAIAESPKYYENGISEPTGNLEEVTSINIRGWAWNAKYPNTSLVVHIKLVNNTNGSVFWIGGVNANQFRIDLLQNGIGNGYHEFNYNINWDDYPLGDYSIYVYPISGTNPPVAGCPKTYANYPNLSDYEYWDGGDPTSVYYFINNDAIYNFDCEIEDTISGKSTKDFSYFLRSSVDSYAIPGLRQTNVSGKNYSTMIPQGICRTDKYILISAYEVDYACRSVIYILDSHGNYITTAVYRIANHVGGLAYDADHKLIWVCESDKNKVTAIKLQEIDKIVYLAQNNEINSIGIKDYQTYDIGIKASYCTYYDGKVWVGTSDANEIRGFKAINLSSDHLDSDVLIKTAEVSQGMSFYVNGNVTYLAVSSSYGRGNPSHIYCYKVNNYSNLDNYRTITIPNMSENVDLFNSSMYIIFESAALEYIKGDDVLPTDCYYILDSQKVFGL